MILYKQDGGPTKKQKETDPELIMWDRFNTPLTEAEQRAFDAQNKHPWDRGGYDIQGFWKEGYEVDERGHGTDRFKKPNHPTFSWGSKYANYVYPGGVWEDGYYTPSKMTRELYKPDQILFHLKDDPVQLIYGNDTISNPYRPGIDYDTRMVRYKKGGKWMQKASASIKRRGTEGVCTGSKFGGPTCPPGSKRYNLAKVFRAMAKKRKKKKK